MTQLTTRHFVISSTLNLKRNASESAGASERASMSPTRQECVHLSTSSSLQSHPNKDSLVKHFNDAKTKHSAISRLCGDLSDLKRHLSSADTGEKHPKSCRVCSKPAYSICTVCGVSLHILPTTSTCAGAEFFFDYHNDMFFGMAQEDVTFKGDKKSNWTYASQSK
eukprot:15329083-Ditylum_brightwellii.AAC.1